MRLYVGLDLHASNVYCAIVSEDGKRVADCRLDNDLTIIQRFLAPYRDDIETIAVESTFNWYWLVDGLLEAGYDIRLANPAAMQQYTGLKHANDKTDAFWLAEMLRLKILPEGYIYPAEQRSLRDLLRRRQMLVRQRTQHLLSLQSMLMREQLQVPKTYELYHGDIVQILEQFPVTSENIILMGLTNIETVQFLTGKIKRIEKAAESQLALNSPYDKLLTVPGIGPILGMTITLETGDISRFARVGNYSSYCRNVKAEHTSNNKKKASNNRKNGNKYLAWAFIEASAKMRQFHEPARRY